MIALRNVESIDRLTAAAVGVLAAVAAFFCLLMVADKGSDPFLAAPAGAVGQGLNPLLLHPAMVPHPPALFAAYAGLTVPFAYATAALLVGSTERDWVLGAQRWTIAGWALLTLGIGLGAWWAYVVLSWGGYWGWDPVENTSLIPWLTATALLHSMTLYRRRGLLRRWTLALACATFWLTIVATWTTRTGLISSVHAFARNDTLIVILSTLLAVVAATSAGLLAWRWRRFGVQRQAVSLTPRDVAHELTNVALAAVRRGVARRHRRRAAHDRSDGGPRHLPAVRRAARRRRGGGRRAVPAARPGARHRLDLPARRPLAAAGRGRRAAAAALDRRLEVEPLRPGRPRGLLLCRRGRRHVHRGERAAGRR